MHLSGVHVSFPPEMMQPYCSGAIGIGAFLFDIFRAYVTINTLPPPILVTGGRVADVTSLKEFMLAVAVEVFAYFICKWLDR